MGDYLCCEILLRSLSRAATGLSQKMGENTPGTTSEFRIVMEDQASSLLQEVRNPPVPKSVCIPPSAHSPNAILSTLILTRNDDHYKSNLQYISAQKKKNSTMRTILRVGCYSPIMSHSPPKPIPTIQL